MAKSPDAFRTISEVADWLGVQAHVLRFWESKFSQVKPVKRAGGRRYYRPNDMLLLGGIRQLLHEDGLTIKGVQKLLREEGISHVAALSQPLDELTQSEMEEEAPFEAAPEAPAEETGTVLTFEKPPAEPEADPEPVASEPEALAPKADPEPEPEPEPEPRQAQDEPTETIAEPTAAEPAAPIVATAEASEAPEPAEEAEDTQATLPAFLRRPMATPPADATDNPPAPAEDTAPEPEPAPPAPKPRDIGMPPITPLDEIAAAPGVLTAALRTKSLDEEQARAIAPLLAKLTVLRDSMAARRRPGPSA